MTAPGAPSGTRLVDVVIITRNEAAHIGRCIESVLSAIASRFGDARIVVIDSNSHDDTTEIASRYRVGVYRYRARRMTAAAGRWIGLHQVQARYVLYLDGDCLLVPQWLEEAVDTMEASPSVGVICGARQNAYDRSGGVDIHDAGSSLGGTALYRAQALAIAGGFNPFIVGSEEQELAARLEARGFQLHTTSALMSVHHTTPRESAWGIWRRWRSGMQGGPGQVLRIALSDGLFLPHARRFNRYLTTFAYLAVGALFALAAPWHPRPFLAWLVVGGAVFALLSWRLRSLHAAGFVVADWVSVALASFRGFVETPRARETFEYTLDTLDVSDAPSASAGAR
jgi:glycosyltransferase involved in cell wall biosynthesis